MVKAFTKSGIDRNVDLACFGHSDEIVEDFQKRAEFGLKKYGVTTERTDLSYEQWIQHYKEEVMDAAVYLQAALNNVNVVAMDNNITDMIDYHITLIDECLFSINELLPKAESKVELKAESKTKDNVNC
jgi:hypothetical protein